MLAEILENLRPSMPEGGRRNKRASVVLQGLGGIGKTQVAFEYVRRNMGDYSAVFWVDASSPDALNESGRRTVERLISHYAKKHLGQQTFAAIATDLQIPGQINSSGQLIGNAATSPWSCVRRWMARDMNAGWCLVIDGINDEADGDRMLELLPPCAHGHVIATSRVRIPDFDLISVPVLEEDSSVKLLLESQKASPTEEGISPSAQRCKSIPRHADYSVT